ncbi:Beta-galactosidase 7 [Camellia lanceoleosa]|uniref:Beta-galactosidase 7 n=1 Tax=Camellia lanceoleosa TaxID=1840588 RepID=A0ACC0HW79_9ERIC|nr:Beta-galactosidase 7 [Camellia lanceoleosa]
MKHQVASLAMQMTPVMPLSPSKEMTIMSLHGLVHIKKDDPIHSHNISIRVNGTGQNYGPQFDKINTGIPGPVQLIGRNGDETIIKDLSLHKWNYRTTFQAPLGTNPVVVDMQGMGKGMAWVNGQSIGRYWPSYLAKEDGCSLEACDYRGTYDNNKCVTNCGQPTQRWYHLPRSFIPNDVNTLVLFEEFGGNPAQVNFQTVAPGTVCGNAYEKNNMELSCEGRPISDIRFASFVDVKGTCGSFKKGSCEGGNNPIDILKTACLGKVSCSIQASDDVFGKSNCTSGTTKRLVVEAVC